MTIVHGQIESLKRIKATLYQKGIIRFNSMGDINDFIKNYELEKQEIFNQIEQDLNVEIDDLQADRIKFQNNYDNLKTEIINKLNNKIVRLKSKYDLIQSRNTKNPLRKIFNWLQLRILKFKKTELEKNFNKIINKYTFIADQEVNKTNTNIHEYTINKKKIISERSLPKCRELDYTKEIVDGLNPLIAGAIGENLVVKELEKLSDEHILFNDYSIDFKKPIYNKKENDRIFSIQIDHLLITNSGVFILETKNWSKKSVESFDLRSPIKQIRRTNHALFKLLNSDTKEEVINLKRHHWGRKEIPIRNIIVMINEKPKEKFKYVQVKTLNELNQYISYFEPIFDDSEVNSIYKYLRIIKDQNQQKSPDLNISRQGTFEVSAKPNLKEWLKNNPGKRINDYYSKFG
jgi:hypothetical protein